MSPTGYVAVGLLPGLLQNLAALNLAKFVLVRRDLRLELTRKICVLGDFGVGKTSVIRRFVHGLFSADYQATLGVNCYTREADFALDNSSRVHTARCVIWDIEGGREKFDLVQSYLVGCQGVLMMADVTRPNTLDILMDYQDLLDATVPGVGVCLALNKCDLVDQLDDVSAVFERTAKTADELEAPWFKTSAATGHLIAESFSQLVARSVSQVGGYG